jgi:hypothetical protein
MFNQRKTLAETMKSKNIPIPSVKKDKEWKHWPAIIEKLLLDIVQEYGFEASQRKLRRLAKPQKNPQITKIKW